MTIPDQIKEAFVNDFLTSSYSMNIQNLSPAISLARQSAQTPLDVALYNAFHLNASYTTVHGALRVPMLKCEESYYEVAVITQLNPETEQFIWLRSSLERYEELKSIYKL